MIGKNIFTSKLKNKFRPFNGFISEYVKLKSKWGKIYDISYQHFSPMLFWGWGSIYYMGGPEVEAYGTDHLGEKPCRTGPVITYLGKI